MQPHQITIIAHKGKNCFGDVMREGYAGELSSGIRKNREGKPPLPMAYTDKFIEQLEEFIPHLEELRFNGGEPFAQRIVLDICDMVAEVNPKLKVK